MTQVTEQRRLHEAAAANLAAWHSASTAALGLRPQLDARWWTCAMPTPNIYFSAISVAAAPTRRLRARMVEALGPHTRDRTTSLVSVCDTFDQLDLRTFGLERRATGTWLARPPGTAPTSGDRPTLDGLRIAVVTGARELAGLERTLVAGFGARPPITPNDIVAPGILADPAMRVLAGWCETELVACAMAYVTDVVGIFGVATLPAHRDHGIASALTVAAAGVAPDRPAVLQPTPQARGLYRRLGFVELGGFTHWG